MQSRFYYPGRSLLRAIWLSTVTLVLLSACGGSGGSSKPATPAGTASSTASVVGDSSSSVATVKLSGSVTYDRVPFNDNHVGLNYSATSTTPVRGAVIELVDVTNSVIATGITSDTGTYSLTTPQNTRVKVRVKAQLVKASAPTWDFKVTNNTSGNALYVLQGSLASSGDVDSRRDLNAGSGWDGSQYTSERAAAPFAILDNIYQGALRLNAAGNLSNLPPLELRWSTENKSANGIKALGEIGTSFFDGSAIYILGDANNDADEYDAHVIVHEWAHYLEQNLFRADSFGGNHSDGDKLDMRTSLSEGFANAFASIILDDPFYSDASGYAQNAGFFIDVSRRNRLVKGFYSEGSVGSIFYNYYVSPQNKNAYDFSPLLTVLADSNYKSQDAMTSIFSFYSHFTQLRPSEAIEFNTLMQEQNIFGTTEYGDDENNNAGYAPSLPLYKAIQANGDVVNVCSSAEFGKFNKLANSQLLKMDISQAKTYAVTITKTAPVGIAGKPEAIFFKRGKSIKTLSSIFDNSVSGLVELDSGTHIIEVYDAKNRDQSNTQKTTFCFDVKVTPN